MADAGTEAGVADVSPTPEKPVSAVTEYFAETIRTSFLSVVSGYPAFDGACDLIASLYMPFEAFD